MIEAAVGRLDGLELATEERHVGSGLANYFLGGPARCWRRRTALGAEQGGGHQRRRSEDDQQKHRRSDQDSPERAPGQFGAAIEPASLVAVIHHSRLMARVNRCRSVLDNRCAGTPAAEAPWHHGRSLRCGVQVAAAGPAKEVLWAKE